MPCSPVNHVALTHIREHIAYFLVHDMIDEKGITTPPTRLMSISVDVTCIATCITYVDENLINLWMELV